MQLLVGTSGYSYKEWKGPFYPQKLPSSKMLGYYAERLRTVEINNTFYRMPKVAMLEKWASEVPDDFVFVLKASRRITHQHRLQGEEASSALAYLHDCASVLGGKRGPFLLQLPPYLRKDVDRLRSFLDGMPSGCRVAVEFRHESWQDTDVYDVLRDRQVALCHAETDDVSIDNLAATAGWGYLRLRRETYSDEQLRGWREWIRLQPWQEVYVFFKHEEQGAAPLLAQRFRMLFEDG